MSQVDLIGRTRGLGGSSFFLFCFLGGGGGSLYASCTALPRQNALCPSNASAPSIKHTQSSTSNKASSKPASRDKSKHRPSKNPPSLPSVAVYVILHACMHALPTPPHPTHQSMAAALRCRAKRPYRPPTPFFPHSSIIASSKRTARFIPDRSFLFFSSIT